MSVQRQANLLGQQRLDVPHIRAIESSIAADFDVLAGRAMAGGRPLVVRGFTLANSSVGTASSSVQLATADSILFNLNATEAGTIFWVPADRAVETLNSATNARVDGSFSAGQVNYVGLDLSRTADDSTSDLVQFLDANTLLESPRNVPLARTLDYRIIISTTPFSSAPNIIPVARVTTDSLNQVASVEDARNLMYRLGSGGDFPNQYSSFTWPTNRVEQDPLIANLVNVDKFSGGDKDIRSQKDWMDAVMSRLWEVGGGSHWYSQTADRNLKLVGAPSPAVFTSTSDNFEYGIEAGVPATGLYTVNHLHWQGLSILFENSDATGVYYNLIADQTTDDVGTPATSVGSITALEIGDCIYVDIDRTTNATLVVKKATLQTLGSPAVPGSRVVIAWRTANGVFRRDSQHPINTSYPVATTGAPGSVRLAYAAGTPATPTVAPLNSVNQMILGAGAYLVSANNAALIATGGTGNSNGIEATGQGSGAGILGYGLAANSIGVRGIGTGTGQGVRGEANDTGPGVWGLGFGASNTGVKGSGGTNGKGVEGIGTGTGTGGYFTSGTAAVAGVEGYGTGVARGGYFQGGATNGVGADGIGQGNGYGLGGYGAGTGAGGYFAAAGTGYGVESYGGAGKAGVFGLGGSGGAGVGGRFIGGSSGTVGAVGIGSGTSPGVEASRGDTDSSLPAIKSIGTIDFDGNTLPAITTALKNKVLSHSVARTWGFFSISAGVLTVHDGLNLTSVTVTAVTGVMTVTLAQDMASATYGVSCNQEGGTPFHLVMSQNKAAGSFDMVAYNSNTGTAATTAVLSGLSFIFFVFGVQ